MQAKALGRATIGALAIIGGLAQGRAQDAVAQFYTGRQIALIIPSSAGGGYDLYGRLVARHIGNYIPGNPKVVPSNMSGAAGLVAAQYIYSSGPKDGTALGELSPNAIMEPLIDKQAKYDSQNFNYIGSASAESAICFVRADAPVKTFADAFNQQVILGATGVGGPSTDFPSMYNNLLGTKFKVIAGYPGITEIGLALEKGEIEGTCGSSWSAMTTGHPEWLSKGTIRVIAQENLDANPDIAKLGAPLTISFAKTPEARQVMEFVFAQWKVGRPFVMAPEVPAARVDSVRRAFAQTMQDQDLLAEAQTMKLNVDQPTNGADLQTSVARLMATPPAIVEKAAQAVVLQH